MHLPNWLTTAATANCSQLHSNSLKAATLSRYLKHSARSEPTVKDVIGETGLHTGLSTSVIPDGSSCHELTVLAKLCCATTFFLFSFFSFKQRFFFYSASSSSSSTLKLLLLNYCLPVITRCASLQTDDKIKYPFSALHFFRHLSYSHSSSGCFL